MINVRDQITGTTHAIYGPMTRGFIRKIDAEHFNPLLFERVPEKQEDIPIEKIDPVSGKTRSSATIIKLQKKAFRHFQLHQGKQFEEENKLAIERRRGGK